MDEYTPINTDVNASNPSQEEFDDGRSYNLDGINIYLIILIYLLLILSYSCKINISRMVRK